LNDFEQTFKVTRGHLELCQSTDDVSDHYSECELASDASERALGMRAKIITTTNCKKCMPNTKTSG